MPIEGGDENLFRVKADATGLDLSVGTSLPNLIGRLLPAKFRTRKSVSEAITKRILEKIRGDEDFSEAEVAFAEEILDDRALRYIRLKQIQSRARDLFDESPVTRLIEAGQNEEPSPSQTSDDWVNKFREDASLVDDELIREIYARVLNEEAQRPSAFSLRTLGVLRYLDRNAAAAFGLVQKVLIDGSCVPGQSPEKTHILNSVGLDHTTMLMLDDAGLINAATASNYTKEAKIVNFELSGHGRILALRRNDRETLSVSVEVHLLTPAGEQLARIADCEPDESALNGLTTWLGSHVSNSEVLLAKLPSRSWSGRFGDLTWERIDSR